MTDVLHPQKSYLDNVIDNLHGQVFITTVAGEQQGHAEGSGWVKIDRIFHTPEGPISFLVLDNGTIVNWRNVISVRPLQKPQVTLDPAFPKGL